MNTKIGSSPIRASNDEISTEGTFTFLQLAKIPGASFGLIHSNGICVIVREENFVFQRLLK